MFRQTIILAFPMLSVAMTTALATELNVMSGQAIEAGLVVAVEAFRQQTGNIVKITYATTPQMRRRIDGGETPDVVIAPPALLDELANAGKIDRGAQVSVGRVGVGVAVRAGAPKPDVSTVDALKRAVLDADSIIYNRASSGLYVEGLLQRLGLAEQIQARTKRYAGTDMVDPLIHGTGKEIGFMPVAEILHFRDRGMELAGPLPAEVQHYTSYAAAPSSTSRVALEFVRFLGTPIAKNIFLSTGID
jgi:molybdate transport system substrate-binding protein